MRDSLDPTTLVVDAVTRACKRSANTVHLELKRGVNSLATIAATAPFLGLLGTVIGIMNSFPGVAGDRRTDMANNFRLLADSLVPILLSLLVALPSLWLYNWLTSEVKAFDLEMDAATTELANYVSTIRVCASTEEYPGRKNA